MDWIAMILSLVGVWFNARKNALCWPIWMISNVFWVVYSIRTLQVPLLVLWIAFLVANAYGWITWRKDAAAETTA